jgi:hypothetical protein
MYNFKILNRDIISVYVKIRKDITFSFLLFTFNSLNHRLITFIKKDYKFEIVDV